MGIFILIYLGIFILSSILVRIPDYKYYKSSYYALKRAVMTQKGVTPYYQTWFYDKQTDRKIIYFGDRKSFAINFLSSFIHNSFITYLDPYTLYWYIKYRKLIKTKL